VSKNSRASAESEAGITHSVSTSITTSSVWRNWYGPDVPSAAEPSLSV
jgi:hypothetical protein